MRQRGSLGRSDAPRKRAILFTDLQRSITDVDTWTNDTLVPTLIVPLEPSTADNLSLDSAWFESPVRRAYQKEALHVRIRNHGQQESGTSPCAAIDGNSARSPPSVWQVVRWWIPCCVFAGERPSRHWGEVSLNDRPVTFDDRLYRVHGDRTPAGAFGERQ
ncbi:MAG: hypothetical protein IPH05_14345 [Flavobacteriales bacterium]|nr:hypothetical protein [Flavobacteriales bacterium]